MGIAATFVSASMVKRLGLFKVWSSLDYHIHSCLHLPSVGVLTKAHCQAGAVGLFLQASLLMMAVAVYWSGTLSQQTPLFFFLFLIVSSSSQFQFAVH